MFAQSPSRAKYMHVCKKLCSWDVPLKPTTKNPTTYIRPCKRTFVIPGFLYYMMGISNELEQWKQTHFLHKKGNSDFRFLSDLAKSIQKIFLFLVKKCIFMTSSPDKPLKYFNFFTTRTVQSAREKGKKLT